MPGNSDESTVTDWIERLKGGDQAAATKLWNRYVHRLIGLARGKLRGTLRRVADEEDVVLQAFDVFFRRAQDGHFPRLNDRHDLWHLLVMLTERRACNQARDLTRRKRGGGKVRGDSALGGGEMAADGRPLELPGDNEPTPEFAAMMAESFEGWLGMLEPDLRQIALLKLEGYTNREIAERIHRAEPTVERRLKLIRDIWRTESP